MQNLLTLLVTTFFLILPAGIANMMPVLVAKVPFLNAPMDFGYSFRGKRIFGDHKTWRGLVFGMMSAGIVNALLLLALWNIFGEGRPIEMIGYQRSFYAGLILGAGALLGDAIKSFFKRQLNIAPGKSWVPFDQVDWILGALIAVHFLVQPQPTEVWIAALLLFGLLHPVINILGYVLHIKKKMF